MILETIEVMTRSMYGFAVAGGILGFLWFRVGTSWRALAKEYGHGDAQPSVSKLFQVVILHQGGFAYNRYQMTRAGVSNQGITLSLAFPLSAFHPPIVIPFHHISVQKRRWFLIDAVELTVRDAPNIKIVMWPELLAWLEKNGRVQLAPPSGVVSSATA